MSRLSELMSAFNTMRVARDARELAELGRASWRDAVEIEEAAMSVVDVDHFRERHSASRQIGSWMMGRGAGRLGRGWTIADWNAYLARIHEWLSPPRSYHDNDMWDIELLSNGDVAPGMSSPTTTIAEMARLIARFSGVNPSAVVMPPSVLGGYERHIRDMAMLAGHRAHGAIVDDLASAATTHESVGHAMQMMQADLYATSRPFLRSKNGLRRPRTRDERGYRRRRRRR